VTANGCGRAASGAPELLPVSVVTPTRNRALALGRTLESLAKQTHQPVELIIVDASDDTSTRSLCATSIRGLRSEVKWQAAGVTGAASQRNEGVRACSQPVIGFIDDDILFEPFCFRRLWAALQSDEDVGGVNAMIINQHYTAPGRVCRSVFRLMAGQRAKSSYAGRVLGPAVNLLPEDRDDLPDVVSVEWLNTTCTMYRRVALPDPPFPAIFTGYSLMEDLTLSLTVGKKWKLANARTARIYHDSQPGSHKSDPATVAEMQLVNRHYVMTKILNRKQSKDYLKLAIWMAFSHLSLLTRASGWRAFAARLRGECRAVRVLLSSWVHHTP
jgi:glycosyltransferase involved in cell wall biosynthesis